MCIKNGNPGTYKRAKICTEMCIHNTYLEANISVPEEGGKCVQVWECTHT